MFLPKARPFPISMLLYQKKNVLFINKKHFKKGNHILLGVPSILSPYSMPKFLNMGYMLNKLWCMAPVPAILIEWSGALSCLGFGISKWSSSDFNEHGNFCSMPSFSHGNEHAIQNMTALTFSYSFRTEIMIYEREFILTLQFQAYCLTFLHVLDTVGPRPDLAGLLLFLCNSPLASVCFCFSTTLVSFFGGLPKLCRSLFGHKYR